MIDDTPFTKSRTQAFPSSPASPNHGAADTLFSWLALAAVVMGVTGAVGGSLSSRRRRAATWRARGDRYELTPPHGDKLRMRY